MAIRYIEDIFIDFADTLSQNGIGIQPHDRSATYSFYQNIRDGNQITQNQANYILKLLDKYKNVVEPYFNYKDDIINPIWKKPFRVLDLSKKIWVENDDGSVWVCLKFPYQLKETFEEEFKDTLYDRTHIWDQQRRIRKCSLYEWNLIALYEFAKKHEFEIDDTFVEAMSLVEEVWNNQESFIKKSMIKNSEVILKNATDESLEYFQTHKIGNIQNDLMLAKSMGHYFDGPTNTIVEKICSNETNHFWIKNQKQLLELVYSVEGKTCIILDRTSNVEEWIKSLSEVIENENYNPKDFRVCFRTSNKDNPEFNDWVRDKGFGGKIDTAKVLIFQFKPAKWLFKSQNYATIVASNNLYPTTNTTVRAMFKSHPCVLYVGDIQPSMNRKENIVEL